MADKKGTKFAGSVKPRIIVHGGAGNIRRDHMPKSSYDLYKASLLAVLSSCEELLEKPDAAAVDVATHAVTMLEDNPIFNAGKGGVFTRNGTIELESSIVVSNGHQKRAVGCMLLKRTKNPIKLAREVLIRGDTANGGGAQGHCQLAGDYLEELGSAWGLETVDPSYFFTQKRWDEHQRGLRQERKNRAISTGDIATPVSPEEDQREFNWDDREYLPQGTVGAVVLDRFGTICVATSTGGLTNKLPGRIGDTPSIGAGFWAEEWHESHREHIVHKKRSFVIGDLLEKASRGALTDLVKDCLAITTSLVATPPPNLAATPMKPRRIRHVVGMSGTGNGDSFLQLNAVRTAAAISRFSSPSIPLADAVHRVSGPGGELQKSAGDRWGRTGEGEGGIIGIELVGTKSKIVWDFNCGGMFRAWIDDDANHRFMVFRDEF